MPRRKATPNNNNAGETDIDQPPKAKKGRVVFNVPLPARRTIIGNVLVCGTGDTGQLGLGEDVLERKRLAPVESLSNIVDICAGGMHCLALTSDGIVYSFGCNDEGALGRDTTEEGSETRPAAIDLPGKVLCISAGDSHSACLMEDGRVYAWGSFRDSHGNMGLTIDGNKRFPIHLLPKLKCSSIASGADHLVILTSIGKVFTVGCGEQGQLGRISQRSISGEGRRGKKDLLYPGELVFRRTAKPIDAIWATNYCTFMRESDTGYIWAVGLNNYKQLVYENETQMLCQPVKTAMRNIKQIAGGQHHTLVLNENSKCFSIGRPDYGRLGLGVVKDGVVNDLTAVSILVDIKIAHIACGEACSYAITQDGNLYTWGFGSNNQLGQGEEDDELVPKLVKSKNTENKRILLASGGGQHSIFLAQADEQPKSQAKMVTVKKDAKKKETTQEIVVEATQSTRNDVADAPESVATPTEPAVPAQEANEVNKKTKQIGTKRKPIEIQEAEPNDDNPSETIEQPVANKRGRKKK